MYSSYIRHGVCSGILQSEKFTSNATQTRIDEQRSHTKETGVSHVHDHRQSTSTQLLEDRLLKCRHTCRPIVSWNQLLVPLTVNSSRAV